MYVQNRPNEVFMRHGGKVYLHAISCTYKYQESVEIYQDEMAQHLSSDYLHNQSHQVATPYQVQSCHDIRHLSQEF